MSVERICIGAQQYAILSASLLGTGECPICHQQVRVSSEGITYAHLAAGPAALPISELNDLVTAAMNWSGAEPSTSVLCRAIDAYKVKYRIADTQPLHPPAALPEGCVTVGWVAVPKESLMHVAAAPKPDEERKDE